MKISRPMRFSRAAFHVAALLGALGAFFFLSTLWGCHGSSVESITARELRDHVEFLASDELAGRMTGESGVREAERYIAEAFAGFGLKPLPGDDDHFIDFEVYEHGYDPEETALEIRVGDDRIDARPGVDFKPFFFTALGVREADVVFAGYGITAPEHGWDDYAGLDVRGKIVLVLRHEPPSFGGGSGGSRYTRHSYFVTKGKNARAHGAVGMILFTDPRFSEPRGEGRADDLRLFSEMRLSPEPRRREPSSSDVGSLLAVHVSQDLAGRIAGPAGWSLEELQQAADSETAPAEIDLGGIRARLAVQRRSEPVEVGARNVVGFLEGRDPVLKDEWIVVGGHHDHVGGYAGEGDTIFNGADDNASGASGVMELAEAFASLRSRPRRSLVFMTFGAEEVGLLGSRALVEQEKIPIERLVFMLNFDMIGRNPDDPVEVFSGGHAGFDRIVEEANASLGLELDLSGVPSDAYSDYYPFYKRGIPFAYFFTGLHEDYHQVDDHADRLAYGRMERIVRLAYRTLAVIADREDGGAEDREEAGGEQ